MKTSKKNGVRWTATGPLMMLLRQFLNGANWRIMPERKNRLTKALKKAQFKTVKAWLDEKEKARKRKVDYRVL